MGGRGGRRDGRKEGWEGGGKGGRAATEPTDTYAAHTYATELVGGVCGREVR